MQSRGAELATFLTSFHQAVVERANADSDAYRTTDNIMRALQDERPAASLEPNWLPVCDRLEDAMENIDSYASHATQGQALNTEAASLVTHAHALRALAPKLAWWHRTADVEPGSPFSTAHANATIVGKGGLEERDDVWVGISLMAPGIEYPEHHHPPEEVYLVLSPGHWQQASGEWFEPEIGGLVYNSPNILHAMRSGSAPLLATWCLWKGD